MALPKPADDDMAAIMAPPKPAADDRAALATMRAEMERELSTVRAIRAKLEADALQAMKEDEKRREFGKPTPSAVAAMPPKPDGKIVTVRLDRNYAPTGWFDVVGYHKDAVTKKNAAGQIIEISPAEFIKGERKPPHIAGVGFPSKVWAGTVLRVAETEARSMKKAGIGTLDFD